MASSPGKLSQSRQIGGGCPYSHASRGEKQRRRLKIRLMLLVRSNEYTEGIECRRYLAWQVVKGGFRAEPRHYANNGEYEERDRADMENTEESCIRGILAGQSIELWG